MRSLHVALVLSLVLSTSTSSAQEVWRGDFETGDTSQFDGELNGRVGERDPITIVDSPVAEGDHAVRIELLNEARWPNGLKRVELHHSPADGRTDDGEALYFAWSIYLPETLPRDPDQQIAYWETDSSYSQLMAFTLIGTDLRFSTNHPEWHEHWLGRGVVTPGVWHRIAMHIVWSRDADTGTVDVWFDGEQVVTAGHAQTLVDTNSAFTQMGLLRGAIEFGDTPVIVIDDAVEGDSLESVRPEGVAEVPDAGVAAADVGVADVDAGTSSDASLGDRDAGVGASVDASSRTDAGPSTLSGSCACRTTTGERPVALFLALPALLGVVSRRRRRARS